MRHKKGYRKLNKPTDQRIALLRSIVGELLREGRIITSKTRALESRRLAEKIITLAKKDDLSSQRKALSCLPNAPVIKEIFISAKERFKERNGGYTRITKLGRRRGDATQMVLLELL